LSIEESICEYIECLICYLIEPQIEEISNQVLDLIKNCLNLLTVQSGEKEINQESKTY